MLQRSPEMERECPPPATLFYELPESTSVLGYAPAQSSGTVTFSTCPNPIGGGPNPTLET